MHTREHKSTLKDRCLNTTDKPADVKFGSWAELKPLALPVRLTVFVEEQGVPIELEQDEFDSQAMHAIMFDSTGQVIATGRLVLIDESTVKIGRLAVLKDHRGSGNGKHLLAALIAQAKALNARTVKLHAQCDAELFYRSFGFAAQGDIFMEAGIEHVLMVMNV